MIIATAPNRSLCDIVFGVSPSGSWTRLAAMSTPKLMLAAISTIVALATLHATVGAEELTPPPCNEDAMIVFDASGSMAGNVARSARVPNQAQRLRVTCSHRRDGKVTCRDLAKHRAPTCQYIR